RERLLTNDELMRMRSYEVARLDPVKVDASLRPLLINRLLIFGENEAAVELLEKTGVPDELRDHWLDCIDDVVAVGRKDLLVRLQSLRDPSELQLEDYPFSARLLTADPIDALRLIEETALNGLKRPDSSNTVDLAHALLDSQWP